MSRHVPAVGSKRSRLKMKTPSRKHGRTIPVTAQDRYEQLYGDKGLQFPLELSVKSCMPKDASVSSICSIAGIARKTGYKWDEDLQQKLSVASAVPAENETEYEKLKKEIEQLKFENKGWHLAWEIHDVEKILAEKKTSRMGTEEKGCELPSQLIPSRSDGCLGVENEHCNTVRLG